MDRSEAVGEGRGIAKEAVFNNPSRAPYFHNGSASSPSDVIDFYNQRFNIGFTAREKADLIAFLNTL
jgi:cytochrome c peroxidase